MKVYFSLLQDVQERPECLGCSGRCDQRRLLPAAGGGLSLANDDTRDFDKPVLVLQAGRTF